jgi:hypothetical protein
MSWSLTYHALGQKWKILVLTIPTSEPLSAGIKAPFGLVEEAACLLQHHLQLNQPRIRPLQPVCVAIHLHHLMLQ